MWKAIAFLLRSILTWSYWAYLWAAKASGAVGRLVPGNAVFHWLLGVVYLSAFLSLYLQWDGLLSYNGIEPVDLFVVRVRSHFLRGDKKLPSTADSSLFTTGASLFQSFGSLVVLAPELGMTADGVCECLLLVGLMSSALIVAGLKIRPLFLICWLSYMSLQHVGQTWLSFQWDILLLEVGFLAIFSSTPLIEMFVKDNKGADRSDTPLMWCYRFLAWKLMFLSGVVKLQSKCPTWEGLTALEYHFATQCLPTPLAWFAHQLPPVIMRLSVAATLVLEIPLAFFLLSPLLQTRRIGALLQIIFQVAILLTGNYTFFNLLTITLMVPAWIDDNQTRLDTHTDFSTAAKEVQEEQPTKLTFLSPFLYLDLLKASNEFALAKSAVKTLTHMTIIFWCITFVTYKPLHRSVSWSASYWTGEGLRLRVKWGDMAPFMPWAGLIAVSCATVHALLYGLRASGKRVHTTIYHCTARGFNKWPLMLIRLTRTLFSIGFAVCWIFISAMTLSSVANVKLFVPQQMHSYYKILQPFSLVSSYGLFRSMTGVSARQGKGQVRNFVPSMVARPEIVIQGLHEGTQKWLDIPFLHKPGDLHMAPTVVAPLQPRLDWQMWFAALGTANHNPWFIHLIYRLLHDEPRTSGVVSLLSGSSGSSESTGAGSYPSWGSRPTDRPAAIRAILYEYDFTRWNTSWARAMPESFIVPFPDFENSEVVRLIRAHSSLQAIIRGVVNATSILDLGLHTASSNATTTASENSTDVAIAVKSGCTDGDSCAAVSSSHIPTNAWYGRRNPQDYLPAVDRSSPELLQYVRSAGFDPDRAKTPLSNQQLYESCAELASTSRNPWKASLGRAACKSLLVRPSLLTLFTKERAMVLALFCLLALIVNSSVFFSAGNASESASDDKKKKKKRL